MLDKLTARTALLRDRTSQFPFRKVLLGRKWVAVYWHVAAFAAFSILGAFLFWPIFGPDYPSGVDTATFLHLSWVTKLAASGQLADPLQDPYWYGGFSYIAAYPPLGYGLVGIVSFVTRLDIVNVYLALLVMGYAGLATATYWLTAEMGLSRRTAVLAGVLAALAYPVLNAIFLWGWFTSVLALPLGLMSIMLLERSLRTSTWGPAAWGGLCMALSILAHHMTGLSLGLGLVGWFLFHVAFGLHSRRRVVVSSALFVAITALLVIPWGIPFVMHITDVGFRREIPGLWLPDLGAYRANITDSTLIGAYVYPSYLGITLMALATGGTVYALVERQRLAGISVILLVLVWFSMGANANPLIRVYPFSGLDTARFHLYMVPFMALLGGALVERILSLVKDLWPALTPRIRRDLAQRLWYVLVVAVFAAILVFPARDAWKARGLMEPYQVNGSVAKAIDWLAERASIDDEVQGSVYSVGLWNWHSFLIPYLADQPLTDGWHDEGAPNVREVRKLRLMGWTGNVDIQEAHRILSELDTGYVLIKRTSDYPAEHADIFWDGLEANSELFWKREQWGDVAVFQLLR